MAVVVVLILGWLALLLLDALVYYVRMGEPIAILIAVMLVFGLVRSLADRWKHRHARRRRPSISLPARPTPSSRKCASCQKRRRLTAFDDLSEECRSCAALSRLSPGEREAVVRREEMRHKAIEERRQRLAQMSPEERAAYRRARNNEYQKAWHARHPGYGTALARRWRAAYPEKYAARKAREHGATEIELVKPLDIFERDGWICHICGEPVDPADASLDHVVPIARGGQHTAENLACSHRTCNFAKKAEPPRPCGNCGEMVMAGAKRCRWCGMPL